MYAGVAYMVVVLEHTLSLPCPHSSFTSFYVMLVEIIIIKGMKVTCKSSDPTGINDIHNHHIIVFKKFGELNCPHQRKVQDIQAAK